jgi:WD repeat-containing protein 35
MPCPSVNIFVCNTLSRYKDGAVIMGSLDGNRLWGKETGIAITRVEWSPDCRLLLFVCESGDVRVHDHHGNFLMNLPGTPRPSLDALLSHFCPGTGGDKAGAAVELVHWYDKLEGLVDVNAPTLAVAFSNGRVSLLRNETDTQPVLIDTGLIIQVLAALFASAHFNSPF